MAESRRSCRSRKQIDYSKFSGDGSDNDDFQDSSPPTKKRKEKAKSEVVSNSKLPSVIQSEDSGKHLNENEKKQKSRISVSDKVFQRNLEAALELSKSQEKSSKTEPATDDDFKDNLSKVANVKLTKLPEVVKKEELHSDSEDESDSSFEEEKTEVRSKAKGSPKIIQKVSDSSSDYNSDSSEEEKTKKNPKVKVKPLNNSLAHKKSFTSLKKPLKIHDDVSYGRHKTIQVESSVKPSFSKNNKACNIPSVGLRLGLSRKAIVKSLHPVLQK